MIYFLNMSIYEDYITPMQESYFRWIEPERNFVPEMD